MFVQAKIVQELSVMTESSGPLGPNLELPVTHTDALSAGERLGEFEILNLLGVGGFGMVYRAYDHSLHRTVAIKEYMPSALAGRSSGQYVSTRSSSDQTTLAAGLRSFVSEARLLAQFEHPSLVKVYRFWEANNTAYMVMPLYSGMTFRQVRAQLHKPPTEAWLRTVLWSILGALKYLHENNIVHRDVSPDNIFLQEVGPPILLDLGAARRAITDSSQKHTAILKVNYAPIEQYAGAADLPQGPWTDLYSIAAVVHGCLCNEAPLPATFRVLRDGMPTFASVASTVQTHFGQSYSREFVQAIGHALAIQPNDRPQSVQAFSDEMALHPPVDVQHFAWRDGLDLLQARVLIGASSGVTQPQPAMDFEATVIHTKTVDLRATPPGQGAGDPDPADLTQPGPLSQDRTSLTTDSVFSGLAGASHPRHVAASAVSGAASAPAIASKAATAPAATAKAAASRKPGLVAAVIAAVVLLGGLAFWGAGKPAPEPAPQALPTPAVVGPPVKDVRATPEAEIINEVQAKPAAVAAAPASAPARPAVPSVSASASKSGNVGGGVNAGVGGSVAAGMGGGVPGNAAATGAPGAAGVASAPSLPKRPASAPARVPAAEAAPTRADSPAAPAESRPAAVQERRGPVENCASSNFLTRSMCIFQECEKPEYSRLPYCVENRRRQQENAVPNSNR